ncbi:hypothetical protein [Streptomyces griseosporeus]|uniref:hypothetical protein n=1 Tax=Streptomyces griseosporeus TaxID=1910 RepID=UPI003700CD6E
MAAAPRGGELVVVGRNRDSLNRNVFGPLMDPALMGPMAKFTKYTNGASTATIVRSIAANASGQTRIDRVVLRLYRPT